MHHVGHNHDGQRLVHAIKEIARRIEKQDVTDAQHQSGHTHGQRGQGPNPGSQPLGTGVGFLHQIRRHENEGRSNQRRQGANGQAVEVGAEHPGLSQPKQVVSQRQFQVVWPQAHQGGVGRHAQHGQHDNAYQSAVQQQRKIALAVRLWHIWHRTRAQAGVLLALDVPVGGKRHQHRCQQQQGHHRTPAKIVHAHHLNVDFHRQHREVAANDFGNAELAYRIGEHHQRGTDQAVLCAGQCDGAELAPA